MSWFGCHYKPWLNVTGNTEALSSCAPPSSFSATLSGRPEALASVCDQSQLVTSSKPGKLWLTLTIELLESSSRVLWRKEEP